MNNFPMIDGPSIPRSLAEVIYVGYVKNFGNNQSLERIEQRGGFYWNEVPLLYKSAKIEMDKANKEKAGGQDW